MTNTNLQLETKKQKSGLGIIFIILTIIGIVLYSQVADEEVEKALTPTVNESQDYIIKSKAGLHTITFDIYIKNNANDNAVIEQAKNLVKENKDKYDEIYFKWYDDKDVWENESDTPDSLLTEEQRSHKVYNGMFRKSGTSQIWKGHGNKVDQIFDFYK